jgi:hypothetical protein
MRFRGFRAAFRPILMLGLEHPHRMQNPDDKGVRVMENLTREETRALIGPADDDALAEIVKLGATRAELAAAVAWIENDEAMLNEGRHIPSGRVAQIVDIIKAREEEDEDLL